jgi:hypothetical protein
MRVSHAIFSFLLLLGSGALAWVLGDAVGQKLSPSRAALETHSYDWISDIEAYHDKDFGFRMAVPAGWQAIDMSIDYESEQDGLAIAHSVGFEAPRESDTDVFADYVMIEIFPGSRSGKFETDGTRAKHVMINGVSGIRESLAVDQHRIGESTFDLVVHQAEIRDTGYTVGFYAIGEPRNRQLIDDAFELLIRTFTFDLPPYRVI